MTDYKCSCCGKVHRGLPMDLAYERPAEYFKVPEEERGARVFMTSDICVIDDKEFLIRGVLELPVTDADGNFRWGVWALVTERDFKRYLELWDVDNVENEPPLAGLLSGGIRGYSDSDLLEVYVHLQADGQRPRFTVFSQDHPLGKDQLHGISIEKVHSFIEAATPNFLN